MKQQRKKLFVLRFDDICPTMRWDIWSNIEPILIERNIKPILAVVPDNQDPVLQVAPPVNDFWQRVRRWQALGWTIAMHGYQHLYVAPDGGLVTLRKKSEFASLPLSIQEEKLRRATEIFTREGVNPHVWIAPGNAFDETTVSLLHKFGMDTISAGWSWRPFVGPHDVTWVPCQLSIYRPVPAGVWTVCSHHNSWTHSDFCDFVDGVSRYHHTTVSLQEALDLYPPKAAKWRYHFCTSLRTSSFLIRAHLKLCKIFHNLLLPQQGEPSRLATRASCTEGTSHEPFYAAANRDGSRSSR
jgi:peptidoglycan/xylan/chitin deacetylase (PgdA/CDA1 family)